MLEENSSITKNTGSSPRTHTQPFYGSLDFVQYNPGESVPEETFTHSHPSWSSNIPICFPQDLEIFHQGTSTIANVVNLVQLIKISSLSHWVQLPRHNVT